MYKEKTNSTLQVRCLLTNQHNLNSIDRGPAYDHLRQILYEFCMELKSVNNFGRRHSSGHSYEVWGKCTQWRRCCLKQTVNWPTTNSGLMDDGWMDDDGNRRTTKVHLQPIFLSAENGFKQEAIVPLNCSPEMSQSHTANQPMAS